MVGAMITCVDCGGSGEVTAVEGDGFALSERCGACDGLGEWPGAALTLHPDPAVRDPYGVVSRQYVDHLRNAAQAWLLGYNDARARTLPNFISPAAPGYAGVRDFLLGYVDVPAPVAQLVALWVTRDSATQYFLSFTVVL
jgi:hypothetical protein